MDSSKGIEFEGISNMIEEGAPTPEKFGAEGGDESYADSSKRSLRVKKVIGDGMGAQPNDGTMGKC